MNSRKCLAKIIGCVEQLPAMNSHGGMKPKSKKHRILDIACAVLLAIVILILPHSVAQAATITVTSTSGGTGGPGCKLRDAITAANSDTATGGCTAGSGADTIELASGATYTLTAVDNSPASYGPSGLPIITSEVTINANGSTIERSSTGGIPEFRIFRVNVGGMLHLIDATIRYGISNWGGGLANFGMMDLNTVTVTANQSTFMNYAGGIFNSGFDGGGILSITNSNISGNSGFTAGGIYSGYSGAVTITDSTIAGNSATFGGGMYLDNSNVNVMSSTLTGNAAQDGAGIYLSYGATALVTNCTFVANSATSKGGGIETYLASAIVTNTTFSGNSAGSQAGALYGDIAVRNSILHANPPTNCGGTITDGGGNIRWPDTDSTCVGTQADPNLGPLTDNGGFTATMALQSGSAAINAGVPAICTLGLPVGPGGFDQRGMAHVQNCDSGAYESAPAVPTNVQASDGTYTDKIQIAWDAVSGATSYKLYRYIASTGTPNLIASPTGTTYDDTAPSPGRDFWYWVKACVGSNCSELSDNDGGWRSIIAPGNVQASDGTHLDKVAITWDAVGAAASYRVHRSDSETGAKVQIGSPTTSSFDDTTALPGMTYYYWITSCAWGHCGNYSAFDTGWRFGYLIYLPLIMR